MDTVGTDLIWQVKVHSGETGLRPTGQARNRPAVEYIQSAIEASGLVKAPDRCPARDWVDLAEFLGVDNPRYNLPGVRHPRIVTK